MISHEDTKTDSAVAADLADRLGAAEHDVETIDLGGGRTLVRTLRQEDVVESYLDPDRYADRPRRKTGTVKLLTVPSLAEYVGKHKGDGTEVWVRPDEGRFEAVLDDHEPDGDVSASPGWGDHRATCTLEQTRDWKHWLSLDGQLVDQLQFAEHLEAGLHNVIEPAAADLLEIAQTLHGSRNVDWKSGARLSDGQVQLRYEERIEGKAAGDLEIPQTFTLLLAPFEGTTPVRLVASLRWRLGDGQVRLGYRLQRPDVVLREAVDGLIDLVEAELDLRVLLGTPRPARAIP